jgi:hypothetical protein
MSPSYPLSLGNEQRGAWSVSAAEATGLPSPAEPFDAWQRACAALRAAEARKAPHAEVVRLAEEVIRTRNSLTMDRLLAGWQPRDDILRHLTADEDLLREGDDADWPPRNGGEKA